ncbi:MAG TPA: CoA pyrophosphatase [Aggregatilineales bacterium]|nr:CoA pyrophosphatase [Aggregatilineales bacterium]
MNRPVITLSEVKAALTLPDFDPRTAHRHMSPPSRPVTRPLAGTPKLAAVLILLYPVNGDLAFALMRRTEYPGIHSGQISLPGGSCEPGESWVQTAVRETCEEFGLCDPIEVLGELSKVYVAPSDFEIHPIVGSLAERPAWKPDSREVAEIIEVTVPMLLDHSIKGFDERTLISGEVARIPHYRMGEHKVWGATALILSEFEHRLRAVTE